MDVYLEEIVLFNEKIIDIITKSMGDIMVLYLIITVKKIKKNSVGSRNQLSREFLKFCNVKPT